MLHTEVALLYTDHEAHKECIFHSNNRGNRWRSFEWNILC